MPRPSDQIRVGTIRPLRGRVKAIARMSVLTNVRDLRSFFSHFHGLHAAQGRPPLDCILNKDE